MKTKITQFNNLKKGFFLILFGFLVTSINVQAQYCTATGGNCDDYINQVQFSNINLWSWCYNYSDYSSYHIANVVQGDTYPIYVLNSNHYSNDTCEVWIDWDQDSSFNDTTEYYRLSNDVNPYHTDILVPINAPLGQTKMRVRIRREGIQTPCGDASQLYGEVEDYTVNVLSPIPMVFNFYDFLHIPFG